MHLWQCYELSLIDDGVCGWWQQGEGIVSDVLLQEGKGLVSQISNLKAAAVQKDKSLAQLRETMKGTLTQWEAQLEAQLTAKLQDQLVWHWREQELVNAHQQQVNAKGGD